MTERVQPTARAVTAATAAALAEGELVVLAHRGDAAAFGEIMRRNNRRLFCAARGVLRDDAEAEDAVQEAYLRAFQGLAGFRGESGLSTWLTRITLNEAFGRLRRRRATAAVVVPDDAAGTRQGAPVLPFPGPSHAACDDPEGAAARYEVRRLLNEAIDELPEPFRAVFVLREVEEASVEEAAGLLGLRPETVRTRLHRARRLLRVALDDRRQEEGPTHRGPPFPAAEALRPPIVLSVLDHERLIMLAGTVAGRSP